MLLENLLQLLRFQAVTVGDYGELQERNTDGTLLAQARRHLREQVDAAPDDARAWAAFGAGELQDFELDAAGKAFEKAIELDPRCLAAWAGSGMVHFYCCDCESAIVAFERVVELNPDDGDAWMLLGNSYEGLIDGPVPVLEADCAEATVQRKLAAQAYARACELLKDRVAFTTCHAFKHHTECLIDLARWEEVPALARQWNDAFEKIARQKGDPGPYPAALLAEARAFIELNRFDDAIETLSELLHSVRSQREEMWLLLGRAYMGKKNWSRAAVILEKAMEFKADDHEILNALTECYTTLGRLDRAGKLKKRVAALDAEARMKADTDGV
jgi:tetratricopeptide (TPR) repeat protein